MVRKIRTKWAGPAHLLRLPSKDVFVNPQETAICCRCRNHDIDIPLRPIANGDFVAWVVAACTLVLALSVNFAIAGVRNHAPHAQQRHRQQCPDTYHDCHTACHDLISLHLSYLPVNATTPPIVQMVGIRNSRIQRGWPVEI